MSDAVAKRERGTWLFGDVSVASLEDDSDAQGANRVIDIIIIVFVLKSLRLWDPRVVPP